MIETRLAQKGETDVQKEIWKLCFKDEDPFINFFYANRYKANQTSLLLEDGKILSMLTMLPVETVYPNGRGIDSAMIYAVATHPDHRNKGYAVKLMDFARIHLLNMGRPFTVLVPASPELFGFYRRLGYFDCFYLREVSFDKNSIRRLCSGINTRCEITAISPEEYNKIREKRLERTLHISYSDEDIEYQKNISQLAHADIYKIESGGTKGCMAIEKYGYKQVLVKELLVPDGLIPEAARSVASMFQAERYSLRTPAYSGGHIGGTIRPFGIIKVNDISVGEVKPWSIGYLGLAFD